MTVLQILAIALISMVLWAFPYGLLLGAVVRAGVRAGAGFWRRRGEALA